MMLKFRRIWGWSFSSRAMLVTMAVRAKASVSEKKRMAITVMAQMDIIAPREVACDGREGREQVLRLNLCLEDEIDQKECLPGKI